MCLCFCKRSVLFFQQNSFQMWTLWLLKLEPQKVNSRSSRKHWRMEFLLSLFFLVPFIFNATLHTVRYIYEKMVSNSLLLIGFNALMLLCSLEVWGPARHWFPYSGSTRGSTSQPSRADGLLSGNSIQRERRQISRWVNDRVSEWVGEWAGGWGESNWI